MVPARGTRELEVAARLQGRLTGLMGPGSGEEATGLGGGGELTGLGLTAGVLAGLGGEEDPPSSGVEPVVGTPETTVVGLGNVTGLTGVTGTGLGLATGLTGVLTGTGLGLTTGAVGLTGTGLGLATGLAGVLTGTGLGLTTGAAGLTGTGLGTGEGTLRTDHILRARSGRPARHPAREGGGAKHDVSAFQACQEQSISMAGTLGREGEAVATGLQSTGLSGCDVASLHSTQQGNADSAQQARTEQQVMPPAMSACSVKPCSRATALLN